MLKHGILGLLNYKSMSGYDVMSVFRDSLNFFWSAKTSQIYRELQGLKEKGFVSDQLVKQSGKPDKKLFSITEAGIEEFKTWLRNEDYGNSNSPLCMKVFFCGELSAEENLERFREQREIVTKRLESYMAIQQIIDGYADKMQASEARVYWQMTLDYGVRYCRMLLDWYDSNIEKLMHLSKDAHSFMDEKEKIRQEVGN